MLLPDRPGVRIEVPGKPFPRRRPDTGFVVGIPNLLHCITLLELESRRELNAPRRLGGNRAAEER